MRGERPAAPGLRRRCRTPWCPGTRWSTRTPIRRPGPGLELGDRRRRGRRRRPASRRRRPRRAGRRPTPSRPARRRAGPRRRSASRSPPGRARPRTAVDPLAVRDAARRASASAVAAAACGRSEHHRRPVDEEARAERERPGAPRRSSRCTTCMPPAFSTRTTAPHQPVSTSSTTRPGSAGTSRGRRPRRGATPVAAQHVGSVAVVAGRTRKEGMPRACAHADATRCCDAPGGLGRRERRRLGGYWHSGTGVPARR